MRTFRPSGDTAASKYETQTLDESAVDLMAGSPLCAESCSSEIESERVYLASLDPKSSPTELPLALLRIGDCTDAETYFKMAYNTSARSKMKKAATAGYYSRRMTFDERNRRLDELFAINTSTTERQGRMRAEFFRYPTVLGEEPCPYHTHRIYGVFSSKDVWVGYVLTHLCGQLAGTELIFGHADYLVDGIMIPLWSAMMRDIYQDAKWVKYVCYGLWYNGEWEGLNQWKHSVGLSPFTGRPGSPRNR